VKHRDQKESDKSGGKIDRLIKITPIKREREKERKTERTRKKREKKEGKR
jgi:hypothetical protein